MKLFLNASPKIYLTRHWPIGKSSIVKSIFIGCLFFSLIGCKSSAKYNLSGINIGNAKTYEVTLFKNHATNTPGNTHEPSIATLLTNTIKDKISDQTNLSIVNSKADLKYEGEIVQYLITPTSATAQQTAAQNRLSIAVQVRFTNNIKKKIDFEQRFTHFYDYPAATQLSEVKTEAHEVILERITQNIVNASLGDW